MSLPRWLLPTLLLAACAGGEASHIPHPLALPGAAISTAVENSVYNAKRSKVKTFVTAHLPQIEAEIIQGGGPTLTQAMALAKVPADRQPELVARLGEDIDLYRADAEALTVALMVHGN
ncbi:hypothetical protein [Actibacterium lipolyticum]|uniref:DUF3015 domain-containing protein n=1 Tax=Actibacterium lipolyticum TaxID=1524263 RepID=A0A238JZX7_9RHOB|nr:hypothetical protein [Actibacterium lipolyticum]SMX35256.1 hypothetical protein COL8621_01727 [Actibacterium lipolyticum]